MNANLILEKPSVWPQVFTTAAKRSVSGVLAGQNVNEFQISTPADKGTVTLVSNTTGQFGYDAASASGTDTFQFTASNAAGTSAPATVTINLLDSCDQEFNSSILSHIPSYVECSSDGKLAYYENLNLFQELDYKRYNVLIYNVIPRLADKAIQPVYELWNNSKYGYTLKKNNMDSHIGGIIEVQSVGFYVALYRISDDGGHSIISYISEYPRVKDRQYEENLSIDKIISRIYAINTYSTGSSLIWQDHYHEVEAWFNSQ